MRNLETHEGRRARRLAATFLAGALALAALAALMAAPACLAASPAPGEADARREVEAAMQRYTMLLRTGPPDALAALFTADGELLEPGMAALHGREAIRAFLAPLFGAVDVQEAKTATDAIEVYGNAAYQWGTYRQRVAEKGKPANEYHGRYIASWRHEADSKWRLAKMIVQPFPPEAH
ncbi:MAG: hypothetical protein QOJ16_2627 [Acidobacteriota bacterium]|jgi:uncharacterized protein (TIGR02246 family)|nr:hypothetical protein [Acidobacteriota bacterium]